MTTLRQAIADGDLKGFVAEREAESAPPGDEAKLHRVLASMARKTIAVPATSKRRRGDG